MAPLLPAAGYQPPVAVTTHQQALALQQRLGWEVCCCNAAQLLQRWQQQGLVIRVLQPHIELKQVLVVRSCQRHTRQAQPGAYCMLGACSKHAAAAWT